MSSLKNYFQEYQGSPNSLKDSKHFIENMFFIKSKPHLAEHLFDFKESDRRFISLSQKYDKRKGMLERHVYSHFTCMLQNNNFPNTVKELFCDITDIISLRLFQSVSLC